MNRQEAAMYLIINMLSQQPTKVHEPSVHGMAFANVGIARGPRLEIRGKETGGVVMRKRKVKPVLFALGLAVLVAGLFYTAYGLFDTSSVSGSHNRYYEAREDF